MKVNSISFFIISFLSIFQLIGQDTLLRSVAMDNHKVFYVTDDGFKGDGWEFIKSEVIRSKNVLVGEDHFSNEIPFFVKTLTGITSFDNFYIEVDPYSTRIIEHSLKALSDAERQSFNAEYSDLFSFYALEPEYRLLEHAVNSGMSILGSDQVVMFADRLIFQDLKAVTKNSRAKEIYSKIADRSASELNRFYEVTRNPMTMYFMTPKFMSDLNNLSQLELSMEEHEIIEDMKRSIKIYSEQNHRLRVRLILNQLMKDYPKWKDRKTLFKYGANHMARGESLLGNYDIGNVVANITESNYEDSFHIMIIGESGTLGSIFKTFPLNAVDSENGFYLKHLKPFFDLTEGKQWHMFNLVPLRRMAERGKLKIENENLFRTIKGFDVLVIIPEVTPAKHLSTPTSK